MDSNTLEKIKLDENAPQIYIACLAAYNSGFLHGEWIDASEGVDHIRERIKFILLDSPAHEEGYPCEEWAIHDFQGFGNYRISESHDLEELCEIAELLSPYSEYNIFPDEVITSLIEDYGIEGAKEKMDDDYIGEFESNSDLAYHYVEETGLLDDVSKTVSMYFDYDSFGRDLDLNGDVLSFSGHYFWNR